MMDSRQYFEDVARQWDKLRERFFSEALREKSLAAAGVQRGKIAADIGAGTGFLTEGLIRDGLQVIAVDQSPSMLQAMREKFGDQEGLEYRLGESERLPIPDESVDYAFANMYLHHVEVPARAIAEMARILKPGGTLVLTDMDAHDFDFLRVEHRDRWMGFRREDMERWLTDAGLKDVAVGCADEECCAQSSSGNEYASISVFLASGRKR
jgi:ubiquinone/menaquinone biosynthesis C-methylase UbiE